MRWARWPTVPVDFAAESRVTARMGSVAARVGGSESFPHHFEEARPWRSIRLLSTLSSDLTHGQLAITVGSEAVATVNIDEDVA